MNYGASTDTSKIVAAQTGRQPRDTVRFFFIPNAAWKVE